jgi:hypothetical protein
MMDAVLNRVSSPTFVGRADELAALGGALGRAATGVPAFAFVAGESGVGKSRLVAEFESRARAAGARVFVGHCLELGGAAIPYAPLVDALRPIARELASSGSDLAARLAPTTRSALAEMLPELGTRAAPAAPDAEGGHQARIFEALLALLERLGGEQPVALVLEDLHWADQSTRDFLTFLVRSARSEPLCLVVTYRSDELHRRHPLRPLLAELERTPGVDRLGLERFTRAEAGAQVSAILEAPGPAELVDRVFARSEGNALYTEELLAASADGCLELPDSLRDLLLHRVERLPDAAQEAVRVVSVEHPMRHALLAELSELDAAELRGALREAVAHQVLVAVGDDAYGFRHALVGEAVYSDLLPGERSELHARLAAALEREPGCWAMRAPPPSTRSSPATGTPPTTSRVRWAPRWPRASPPSGCSRSARPAATSSARWSCGTGSTTPSSARAAIASICFATPHWPRRTPARARAPSRSCARRSPASTRWRIRPARPSCSSARATICAGRVRRSRALRPTSPRWSCSRGASPSSERGCWSIARAG